MRAVSDTNTYKTSQGPLSHSSFWAANWTKISTVPAHLSVKETTNNGVAMVKSEPSASARQRISQCISSAISSKCPAFSPKAQLLMLARCVKI